MMRFIRIFTVASILMQQGLGLDTGHLAGPDQACQAGLSTQEHQDEQGQKDPEFDSAAAMFHRFLSLSWTLQCVLVYQSAAGYWGIQPPPLQT